MTTVDVPLLLSYFVSVKGLIVLLHLVKSMILSLDNLNKLTILFMYTIFQKCIPITKTQSCNRSKPVLFIKSYSEKKILFYDRFVIFCAIFVNLAIKAMECLGKRNHLIIYFLVKCSMCLAIKCVPSHSKGRLFYS